MQVGAAAGLLLEVSIQPEGRAALLAADAPRPLVRIILAAAAAAAAAGTSDSPADDASAAAVALAAQVGAWRRDARYDGGWPGDRAGFTGTGLP